MVTPAVGLMKKASEMGLPVDLKSKQVSSAAEQKRSVMSTSSNEPTNSAAAESSSPAESRQHVK